MKTIKINNVDHTVDDAVFEYIKLLKSKLRDARKQINHDHETPELG
jgi:hypothetical protein